MHSLSYTLHHIYVILIHTVYQAALTSVYLGSSHRNHTAKKMPAKAMQKWTAFLLQAGNEDCHSGEQAALPAL